jgi:6-phosphogluconolactonase
MITEMDRPEIIVTETADALAETAAQAIVECAAEAVSARGRFMLALAGGSTPRATYERLAQPPRRDRIPWDRTWVFFGDERGVAPDHPDSNFRMANQALLLKVPIPPRQIARIRGEAEDPEAAATEYGRRLSQVFEIKRGQLPRFDLILLGMGVDGHTGSLFPGSPVLKEVFRPVAAVHATAASIPQRFTFTLPVINAAARVMFLVSGAEKAKVLKAVLKEPTSGLPAALVHPTNGRLTWLLDRAAAALIGGAA